MEQSSSCSSSIDLSAACFGTLRQDEQEKIRRFQENDPTLTKLDLGGKHIGDGAAVAIGKVLETNTTLTKLVLDFNSIGEEGAVAIGKALEMNKALAELSLYHNSIGCEAAKSIGRALEMNTTLKGLHLGCNSIGDEGVKAVGKSMETNTTLTVLILHDNSIGDEGVAAIGKAREKNAMANHLRYLDVSYNGITRLPRSFVKLEGTCKLDVGGNPLLEPPSEIAEQGLQEIARYLEAVDKGATTSRKLKTVLVGGGEAGKTSLRNAIAGRFPAVTQGEEERTIYLDVEHVPIYDSEGYSDGPITLMVYDCGGQQDYAVGQAPFMTASSLFLLVVAADKAHEDYYEEVVQRFLVLLQARAPGAMVQLVLSKVDLVPDEWGRKQWLETRVQRQLRAWHDAAADREREEVTRYGRVIPEDSMKKKKPPLLRILPNVLGTSVTSESAIARAREEVSNTIFWHTQDHVEPRLSSVGTLIPKTWQELWKLFGAVLQCSADADEEVLFSVASSDDAIQLGEIGNMKTTTEGETDISVKRPYCSVAELVSRWNRFRPLSDDATCGDAIGLLEARGDIFVDAGLAYLEPSFVTDWIKPLIDHTLTLERIESSEFGKEIETFVDNCESKRIGLRQEIMEGLTDLAHSGELDALILPFLWRDLKIDREDYKMILQMLLESDVIFASSPHPSSSTKKTTSSRGTTDILPVVLFRLKKNKPSGWEDVWPERVPDGQEQRELRMKMYRGCPPNLTAHFAAATHAYGNCVCAWLNGAIVLDEKNRCIRSELVEIDGGEPYLALSVRSPNDDMLGEETWGLLNGAVSFVSDEVTDHFAGLQYDAVLACHSCVSVCRGQDSQVFGWSKVTDPNSRMSLHFCRKCRKNVDFRVVCTKGEAIYNKIGKASMHKALLNQMTGRLSHFYRAQEVGHDGNHVSPMTAGERNISSLYTQALLDGIETDVGELSMAGVTNPSSVWQYNLGGDPYVFLSHRGVDTKETVARPTHWFLSEILGLTAFFDDDSMETGDDKMRSLMEPAHCSSHALVLLSPGFRESDYCVMELNTFMMRWSKGNLVVLPYLWKMEKVDNEFAPAVKEIIWCKSRTEDPAYYLVEILWPDLIERLKGGRQDRSDWEALSLKDKLIQYVEVHRGKQDIPDIPSSLERFVRVHKRWRVCSAKLWLTCFRRCRADA